MFPSLERDDFNPSPSPRLREEDILVVLGDADVIHTLRKKAYTP